MRKRQRVRLIQKFDCAHRGRGDDGRLGHGDTGWKYVPKITQALQGQMVVQVTCGSYHTAAVTEEGILWTWGGGMVGLASRNVGWKLFFFAV